MAPKGIRKKFYIKKKQYGLLKIIFTGHQKKEVSILFPLPNSVSNIA
jgi:hypothetical protein